MSCLNLFPLKWERKVSFHVLRLATGFSCTFSCFLSTIPVVLFNMFKGDTWSDTVDVIESTIGQYTRKILW